MFPALAAPMRSLPEVTRPRSVSEMLRLVVAALALADAASRRIAVPAVAEPISTAPVPAFTAAVPVRFKALERIRMSPFCDATSALEEKPVVSLRSITAEVLTLRKAELISKVEALISIGPLMLTAPFMRPWFSD